VMSSFGERAQSKALQDALEHFEKLVADGADTAAASREVRAALPAELRAAFALATALPQARAAEFPEPSFAAAFEQRLRSTEIPAAARAPDGVARRHQRGLQGVLAVAAAIVVFATILVPALKSLPGDSLYALKRTSENARALVASGPGEARLRISLANERFREVERLLARSRLRSMGIGIVAADAMEDIDPEVATLIRETLAEAEHQLAIAADIITKAPNSADVPSLERLVAVSQRGQDIAEGVADAVPHDDKSPVLTTVVKLARIEAQANAARMTAEAAEEPGATPCVTATPAPTKTPDASAEPTDEPEATPAVSSTSTPEGTATPAPCVTPTPAPTATPGGEDTQTPQPSAESTPAATDAPDAGGGTEPSSDGTAQSSGSTDALAGQTSG
jgi:hypothetical protein